MVTQRKYRIIHVYFNETIPYWSIEQSRKALHGSGTCWETLVRGARSYDEAETWLATYLLQLGDSYGNPC